MQCSCQSPSMRGLHQNCCTLQLDCWHFASPPANELLSFRLENRRHRHPEGMPAISQRGAWRCFGVPFFNFLRSLIMAQLSLSCSKIDLPALESRIGESRGSQMSAANDKKLGPDFVI